MTSGRPRHGFTMIELLVVLGIVAALVGVVWAIPAGEERDAQVRGAADELAAVLRETRTRAMRSNRTYAVVFNLENAPGSTGRVLNNRSGGHWYRVLGPSDSLPNIRTLVDDQNMADGDCQLAWSMPPLFNPYFSSANGRGCAPASTGGAPPLKAYLDWVERSWIDEAHVLAKGKVRFLALADQDNGDNDLPSLGGYYTATYPRPWFGWWDEASRRLHPWGGYDPALRKATQHANKALDDRAVLVNGPGYTRTISHSAFYYEGFEGAITGCVNPRDRQVLADGDGNGTVDPTDYATVPMPLWTVLKQDEPRPLINGRWVDFAFLFRPDGTVSTDWFRLRNGYCAGTWKAAMPYADPLTVAWPDFTKPWPNPLACGLPDLCSGQRRVENLADDAATYPNESEAQREATSYVNRTGFHWITLARDAAAGEDEGLFPTAEAAARSLLPMYRVGVSPHGLVTVIRVSMSRRQGDTRLFDAAITGAGWEDKATIWGKPAATVWDPRVRPTAPNYMNHQLRNPDGTPRGMPVTDLVLPEMLRERKWWWQWP